MPAFFAAVRAVADDALPDAFAPAPAAAPRVPTRLLVDVLPAPPRSRPDAAPALLAVVRFVVADAAPAAPRARDVAPSFEAAPREPAVVPVFRADAAEAVVSRVPALRPAVLVREAVPVSALPRADTPPRALVVACRVVATPVAALPFVATLPVPAVRTDVFFVADVDFIAPLRDVGFADAFFAAAPRADLAEPFFAAARPVPVAALALPVGAAVVLLSAPFAAVVRCEVPEPAVARRVGARLPRAAETSASGWRIPPVAPTFFADFFAARPGALPRPGACAAIFFVAIRPLHAAPIRAGAS